MDRVMLPVVVMSGRAGNVLFLEAEAQVGALIL